VKQRLILLNLLIAGAVVWCGYAIYQRAQFVRERDARAAAVKASPAPPKAAAPPAPAPVAAASYIDVAQRMLFNKDRNSQVEIVLPPKPPEKPLPPLPVARGVMNLGDGPFVLMAEKEQARFLPVRPGQTVGPFTLAKLEGDQVTLTFEDKTIVKRIDDLRPRVESATAAPSGGAQGYTPPDRAPVVAAPAPAKPGTELTPSLRACVAGDSSAPGTVTDGYRKIVTKTPFGESCRWELVK
jgi:hypothetical protein